MRSFATPTSEIRDNVLRLLIETSGGTTTYQGFTEGVFMDFLRQRMNRFLLESGINPSVYTFAAGSSFTLNDYPNAQPQKIREAVVRAFSAGADPTTKWYMVDIIDTWEADNMGIRSLTIGPPFYLIHDVSLASPDGYQIVPSVDSSGRGVDQITVLFDDAVVLGDTVTGTTSPIPRMFLWGIQWGIIADLLSQPGQFHDPQRAEYAESRFQECVAVAKMWAGNTLGEGA
jgi:hypothetical protein